LVDFNLIATMYERLIPWLDDVPPSRRSLPPAEADATFLRRTLPQNLADAEQALGMDRCNEATRRIIRAKEHLESACIELCEALAALSVHGVPREHREKGKTARKSVRDVLMWCCVAVEMGLDSVKAIKRCVGNACRYTNCGEDTSSQVCNGVRRVLTEIRDRPVVVEALRNWYASVDDCFVLRLL
jgi:hypothetical protein